jgi:hypothetical protein
MRWVTWAFWPTSSMRYAFTSCFGGGIGGLSVLGLFWHRLNCHEPGCWRIGRYHVAGGEYVTCAAHHPDGPPAAGDIAAAHFAHLHRLGRTREDR